MIEIPEDVEQWTYGKIVDLINEGYDENDILEFKREINTDFNRLCSTTCAFANTNGGTIIFGIDNNRQTSMDLHDRIIGMDDSDGLKRTIIDKINNIHPNIPIRSMIFRKSNIKLPNKKVIVILKITSSNSRPHQYNHIFYKRLVDGNEPMLVDEISRLILDVKKNKMSLTLLSRDLSGLYDTFKTTKKLFENDDKLETCVRLLTDFSYKSLEHFLYNQSYLYDFSVANNLSNIIQYIEKFIDFSEHTLNILTKKPKHEFFDETKNEMIQRVDRCIDSIEALKKDLDLSWAEPIKSLYANYFPK